MNKWIAEFDLEDGDTMPEHMDLEYKGVKIDFHCRPKEPVLDKLRAEIEQRPYGVANDSVIQGMKYERKAILEVIDKYKAETEG